MNEQAEKDRETPDLYFAAYVMASGISLAGSKRNGNRVLFRFTATDEEWEEKTTEFFTGSAVVKALDLVQAIKALKGLVHVV